MLGGTLTLYFFVLFAALLIFGSESVGLVELFALGVIGFLCIVVVRSWSTMMEDRHEPETKALAPLPPRIRAYLDTNHVRWRQQHHRRADTAQELAHAVHVTGHRVAKPVLVWADGQAWMIVVPATEIIDFDALRDVLHARSVELMTEHEMSGLFPDCEVGAEPPFGRLYEVPMLVEEDLMRAGDIVCHGGSHDESIELPYADYLRVERPFIAHFARAAS